MKKILMCLVLLLSLAFLIGCQVVEETKGLVEDTQTEETTAVESSEEAEISQGIEEVDDLEEQIDEDDIDFEVLEDLDLD